MSETFDHEEIDKYLSGEMGSFERGLFEHKMAQDEVLRYEVEVRKMAISILEAERIKQLREYIRRNTPHKRQLGFWQQVTLYSSVACALVALVFWVMLQMSEPRGVMAYSDAPHKKAQGDSEKADPNRNAGQVIPAAPEVSDNPTNTLFTPEVKTADVPSEANSEDLNTSPAMGAEATAQESDDYAIKSDEMVLDTVYLTPVLQAAATEESENYKTPAVRAESKSAVPTVAARGKKALVTDSASGYNKSGAISLKVEFWNSPINYRGYRYNGIRLQLYGISDPAKIKFRVLGDELYMWNAGNVCKLVKEDRYNSYWPESDKALLKLFR